MSKADELLNGLTESQIATFTIDPDSEPHIVIDDDRNVFVPDELKRVAVQYDHNIETVTFDCPRYWDGHDLSTMRVYIVYKRADNKVAPYLAKNVIVDSADNSIMHFDWTLSRNATMSVGTLKFQVCVRKTDETGEESNVWHSNLNTEMYISEGLPCEDPITESYPDIITDLLNRMEQCEASISKPVNMHIGDTNPGLTNCFWFDTSWKRPEKPEELLELFIKLGEYPDDVLTEVDGEDHRTDADVELGDDQLYLVFN